jgi:hypothetical protein
MQRTSRLLAVLGSPIMATVAAGAQWQSLPGLQTCRSGPMVVTDYLGRVWAIGGNNNGTVVSSTEYSSGTFWTYGPSLLVPRTYGAVVALNGFIYVIGGSNNSNSALNTVEVLDLTAALPVWSATSIPALPAGRADVAASVDSRGRFWVVGGKDATNTSMGTTFIFDPARPSLGWVSGPPLNQSRAQHGVVTGTDGFVYAIGGTSQPDGQQLNSVERVDPRHPELGWTTLPSPSCSMPYTPQCGRGALGADGRIYVAGGWLPGYTNQVIRRSTVASAPCGWSYASPMPTARNNVGCTVDFAGRLWVVGGDSNCAVEVVDTNKCPADFNNDGVVSVQDLFDFLAAWFAGCP